MKPTFLFFGGVGWCGTTSLWMTLTRLNYLHTGFKKENRFLHRLQEWEEWGYLEGKNFFNDPCFRLSPITQSTLDQVRKIRSGIIGKKKYSDYSYPLAAIKESTEEEYKSELPSLKFYVDFYRELNETIQGKYKVVGDFSNPNAFLSEQTLVKAKQALEPYFNIKSLIILRDPIRRLFSNINSNVWNNDSTNSKLYNNTKTNNATEVFENFINTTNMSNTYHEYDYLIKLYQKVFGEENTQYLIMEDFFKEGYRGEVEKLENYIDYKLPDITPCCFVPDKGINAPRLSYLEDQWGSDHEILTPELYNNARKKLSYIYERFKQVHGYLPADWGSPIDYGY